jgi:hypothetical protein
VNHVQLAEQVLVGQLSRIDAEGLISGGHVDLLPVGSSSAYPFARRVHLARLATDRAGKDYWRRKE